MFNNFFKFCLVFFLASSNLEAEIKLPLGKANSGFLFRSQKRENGSMFGYQAEVDGSNRKWSGGLYDEGRRGWIHPKKPIEKSIDLVSNFGSKSLPKSISKSAWALFPASKFNIDFRHAFFRISSDVQAILASIWPPKIQKIAQKSNLKRHQHFDHFLL